MQKIRQRLDYLDIAKCITIFLVIMGHSTGNLDTPLFRVVLYSFHMPLFFIVSGTVVRTHVTTKYDKAHWKDFLGKNLFMLMVPYLIWGLIYSQFSYKNTAYILYGSWQLLGKAGTLTSLWYLPCLFLARIEMEAVLMLGKKLEKLNRHLYALIIAAAAFAIGFALPKVEIGYIWCADISFVALGFMLLGYSIKEIIGEFIDSKLIYQAAVLLISGGLFVMSMVIQDGSPALVMMCKSDYGSIPLFLLSGLSGSTFILSLSILLQEAWGQNTESKLRKNIIWVGKRTLGVYLLHKPFLQEVLVPLLKLAGLQNLFVIAIIGAVIDLPLCCLMIKVLEKYVPALLGKRQKVS